MTTEIRSSIYTPAEAATIAIEAVRKGEKEANRAFPLPLIGDYFAPVMPGELVIVQAQTSNGKSLFFHDWQRSAIEALAQAGRTDECIIHVSVEDLIETQLYYEMGRETGDSAGDLARGIVKDWGALRRAAIKAGLLPVYRIGASLARAEDMPNLYLSNIIKALEYLINGGLGFIVKPAAIFVDYLQALPIDPEVKRSDLDGQRRLQVREDIYRSRGAAAKLDCPVILAAQSKQTLTGANPPVMMPGTYDVEETSSAAQRADRIVSLWMPKTSYPVGRSITLADGSNYKVEENHIWVKVSKQRGGLPAGKTFVCDIDFTRQVISRLDGRRVQL